MLSHRITALRIRNGISQLQLAQALHVSPSTVSMYEQGRRTPGLSTLVALSQIFGVSLDYLITGADYVYSDIEAKRSEIARDCPCATCYWKSHTT